MFQIYNWLNIVFQNIKLKVPGKCDHISKRCNWQYILAHMPNLEIVSPFSFFSKFESWIKQISLILSFVAYEPRNAHFLTSSPCRWFWLICQIRPKQEIGHILAKGPYSGVKIRVCKKKWLELIPSWTYGCVYTSRGTKKMASMAEWNLKISL